MSMSPSAADLRLRPLCADDEMNAIAAHEELVPEGFDFLLDWRRDQPWSAYLDYLERLRLGDEVPPDRVPATFLVAQLGPDLVGRVSIRHELNAFLRNVGGHIGFGVRPKHRRRGCASEILRQALVVARAVGVDAVLVTCDDDNIASARVIQSAGGVLGDTGPAPNGTPTRRYWIA
jgi:predicted acetyltransferase